MEITVASVSGQAGQTGQRSSGQLTVRRRDQGFVSLVRTCHTLTIVTTSTTVKATITTTSSRTWLIA